MDEVEDEDVPVSFRREQRTNRRGRTRAIVVSEDEDKLGTGYIYKFKF